MKVGIIGSGGREHAICESINKSAKVDKIYCFPGNAGTSTIAENININLDDLEKYPPRLNLELINRWKEYLKYQTKFQKLVVKDYDINFLNRELSNYENNQKIIKKYQTKDIKKLINDIKQKLEYLNYKSKFDKAKKY